MTGAEIASKTNAMSNSPWLSGSNKFPATAKQNFGLTRAASFAFGP
jgi:hypothetical protein